MELRKQCIGKVLQYYTEMTGDTVLNVQFCVINTVAHYQFFSDDPLISSD